MKTMRFYTVTAYNHDEAVEFVDAFGSRRAAESEYRSTIAKVGPSFQVELEQVDVIVSPLKKAVMALLAGRGFCKDSKILAEGWGKGDDECDIFEDDDGCEVTS